ncbi:hypothetical protein ACI6PO_11645 [Agrobacterium tumefaciens]
MSARSPVNISPGTEDRLRIVVISISTFGELGDVSATGVSTSFGLPAQEQSAAIVENTKNRLGQFDRVDDRGTIRLLPTVFFLKYSITLWRHRSTR